MRLSTPRLIPLFALALAATGAHALTFNLAPTGNAQADAGFRAAANLWSAQFLDPITINITSTYRSFGNTTTIGSTQNQVDAYSYQAVRSALIADARYPQNGTDPQVIASLPDTAGIAWRRSVAGTTTSVVDNDNSDNNNFLAVTNANAKALGLIAGNATGSDALIEFNSGFNFDFDRSNGIGANQIDFVGVAFHEIGHAMGFVSGVDLYDGSYSDADLNNAAVFSPLDLLRYTSNDGVKDVRYGAASYFSLNRGATNLGNFSTGTNANLGGDRRQASHWKDNDLTGVYIGAMDPTAANGQLLNFTVRDGAAFDAIGYDVVPEPATMAALGLGTLALLRRRRSKKS